MTKASKFSIRNRSSQFRAGAPVVFLIALFAMFAVTFMLAEPPAHNVALQSAYPARAVIAQTRDDRAVSPPPAAAISAQTQDDAAKLSFAAKSSISAKIGRDQNAYHARSDAHAYLADNPTHGFQVAFEESSVSVKSGEHEWGLALVGFGYGDAPDPIGFQNPSGLSVRENRVEYERGKLTEWYVNGPYGLEQGVTINQPPTSGAGNLTLAFALRGNLSAQVDEDGKGLTLAPASGGAVLRYVGLVAFDADNRELPAWMQVRSDQLLIRVEDSNARYPLTIDPYIQQAKLAASDGAVNDNFGASSAISGDGKTIVVGALGAKIGSNSYQGAAYVFVTSGSWMTMTQTAKLTASDGAASNYFGTSVGISSDGKTIVVGAPHATIGSNSSQGAAYVFVTSGSWVTTTQTAKLTASGGAASDYLGWSVAISSNTIVAGAPFATVNGNSTQGAAYVFVSSGSWITTTTAKLTSSDGAAVDNFGYSVAIDGNTIAVGAPCKPYNSSTFSCGSGAAYVFVNSSSWVTKTQSAKLTASDAGASDGLGSAVAISGNTIVAGAPRATINGKSNQGAAYVFVNSGSWMTMTQTAKLDNGSDGGPFSNFGKSVTVNSGGTIVVGATSQTINYSNQGAAYVYTASGSSVARSVFRPSTTWTQSDRLIASDAGYYDHLGTSVGINASGFIVVGADQATDGVGGAYVFITMSRPPTATIPGVNVAPEPEIKPSTASCELDSPHGGSISIATNPACPPPKCCTVGSYPGLMQDSGHSGLSGAGIYLHSGEFFYHEVDLEIPGRGFNWKFERKYRSGVTYDGPLGHNWEFNYDRRLVVLNNANQDVVRLDGYGRADTFTRNNDGSYQAPTGFYSGLTRRNDGSFFELDFRGSRAEYSAPDAQGVARMTTLSDRDGNTMRFSYDGQSRLVSVSDTLGRTITYNYDSQNHLSYIQDFMGRRVTFTYDSNGDLVTATSPAVTGTPNGNDFASGKTVRYGYSSGFSDGTLNHNMIAITAPNEVASGGSPRIQLQYDSADRVTSFNIGGTNSSGVGAGGTISYTYSTNQTEVFDRNGNRTVYQFSNLGNITDVRKYMNRGVRPNDTAFYETRYEYNADGQLTRMIDPQGNSVEYTYDVSNANRLQQGNLTSEVHRADSARGGDQTAISTTTTYEPIYNQVRTRTEPRGNDPSYVPQNGGAWSAARYTTIYTFDYEEGCDFAAIGAKVGRSASDVQQLLSAAGMCAAPLGDVNGDGITNQVNGKIIRTQRPSVTLLPGSNEATVEGTTNQPIVQLSVYNKYGQLIRTRDPEGNVDVREYYSEQDPNGDGVIDNPSGDPVTGGYLKQTTRDTVSASNRDSNTNPAPTNIRNLYRYDPVGNITRTVDGRGIATDYVVNQLNQVVQTTRAAAHNIFAPDPPEPMTLTDFMYLERRFYDYNNNVVLRQIEDRGNTTGVDGNPNPSDLPPYITNPDAVGGPAYADTVYKYDMLDQNIEMQQEVSNGVSPNFLRTWYRFDPNGNQVLVVQPAGNALASLFDERDLLYQRTRGALAPPPLALLASGDVNNYNVRGGLPSTMTYHYDKNRNVIETVDADDTDGSSANNSKLGGAGDRTRTIYDGFDRRTSTVDSVGNQSVYQYDPAGNAVRAARFGPVGGASPTSDGPDTLLMPVSSGGVIQSANLVNANLLAASADLYDELSRRFQTDRSLFVNTIPTVRSPNVAAGATDIGKGNLNPGSTCAVPGVAVPPSGYLGCVSTRAEYDRNSRLTFNVQDDGDTTRAFYDGANRGIKTLDPEGNTVQTAYDDNNNIIETDETDVSQVASVPNELFVTTYFYDSLNRMQRRVDNLGQTFDFRYDSRDNLVAAADAQGPAGSAITRHTFTRGARTVNTTNLFGNVTLYYYDGLNRRTREERILTASGQGDGVNIGATLEGIKSTTPTPDTNQGGGDGLIRIGYVWDENSLQSALIDDQGNVTVYLYDNLNRRVTETKGLTVNTTPLNKTKILGPRQIVAPTAATINNPAVISATAIDTQLAAAKAKLNVVASLFPPLADRVDDNPPTTIIYGYDPDDNILIVDDENASETFSKYDALNRRIAIRVFRSGQSDSFSGDPLFAPAPVSDPSNPSTTFPAVVGSNKKDFQYDGLSLLTRASDNNEPSDTSDDSVVASAYDSLSRVIEEKQQLGALPAKAISSAWRAENLRSGLTYPNGRALVYTFDGLDRLKTVGDAGHNIYLPLIEQGAGGSTPATPVPTKARTNQSSPGTIATYSYIGKSRVLQRTYANGTRMTYMNDAGSADVGYDGLRRPTQLRHLRADNSVIVGFSDTYDRMNDKLSESKLHNTANNETYSYDSAYRLTRFNRPNSGAIAPQYSNWTLDGAGNWKQVDGETRQHSSFNEITSRGGTTILSDDSGNEFDDGTYRFTWDFQNRLRTVTRKSDNALIAVYSYDALSRRVRKVVTNSGVLNGTTNFYLDDWQEIEERDGADMLKQQYVYGRYIDEPLVLDRNLDGDNSAIGSGDQRLFYHQNTLYSVFGLTDNTGKIVEGYQYDAYGRQTVFSPGANGVVDFGGDDVIATGGGSVVGNPNMFTGRRLDSETGLYYFRARYYDSQMGRFNARDPLGHVAGINLYEYVNSKPTISVDATGLCKFVVGGEEVAAEGDPKETGWEKFQRWIGSSLGIMHVDIYSDNRQIRQGFAGGVPERKNAPTPEEDLSKRTVWVLTQINEGWLSWGSEAGTPCLCAKCEDIADCLRNAPKPRRCEYNSMTNNCQQDVEHAIKGCCLTGYEASGFGPQEWNYWTDKQRETAQKIAESR